MIPASKERAEKVMSMSNPKRFDIKDFGAVGDSVTDDTAAIRAAIDAAWAASPHP